MEDLPNGIECNNDKLRGGAWTAFHVSTISRSYSYKFFLEEHSGLTSRPLKLQSFIKTVLEGNDVSFLVKSRLFSDDVLLFLPELGRENSPQIICTFRKLQTCDDYKSSEVPTSTSYARRKKERKRLVMSSGVTNDCFILPTPLRESALKAS